MPISTTCPQCSRKLRVPDDLIGKRVKCPNCNFNFTVAADEAPASRERVSSRKAPPALPPPEPDFEEVPDEEPPEQQEPEEQPDEEPDDQDDDDEPRRRKKKKKRRGRRRGEYMEPHRGQLVMILGVAGLVLTLVSGVGFPLGLIAWILGHNDLKAMDEGRMDPEGESQTRTGYICGMITTILGLIGLVSAVGFACLWLSCVGSMIAGGAAGGGGGF